MGDPNSPSILEGVPEGRGSNKMPMVVSLKQLYDFRNEDQQSDGGGGDGVHKNGRGSQVLDLLDALVAFGADHIGEVLYGRVEDFAAEDQSDGERHGRPLQRRQFEQRARHDDANGREQMYPAVVLLLEKHFQPVERVGSDEVAGKCLQGNVELSSE